MTLKEFDAIRQYLPDDTEIILKVTTPASTKPSPGPNQDWAVWTCSWGNHDGRFNVMCHACGWTSDDIPARMRGETERQYLEKPCPKCGALFYDKKGKGKK